MHRHVHIHCVKAFTQCTQGDREYWVQECTVHCTCLSIVEALVDGNIFMNISTINIDMIYILWFVAIKVIRYMLHAKYHNIESDLHDVLKAVWTIIQSSIIVEKI